MPGHVFVSYDRADQPYVENLVTYLAARGLDVRTDPGTDRGEPWSDLAREQVDTCAAFVPVLTAHAAGPVSRDLERARTQGRPILPLLLDGEPPASLAALSYDDVRGGRMPSAYLLDRLGAIVRPARAVPATPVSPPAYFGSAGRITSSPAVYALLAAAPRRPRLVIAGVLLAGLLSLLELALPGRHGLGAGPDALALAATSAVLSVGWLVRGRAGYALAPAVLLSAATLVSWALAFGGRPGPEVTLALGLAVDAAIVATLLVALRPVARGGPPVDPRWAVAVALAAALGVVVRLATAGFAAPGSWAAVGLAAIVVASTGEADPVERRIVAAGVLSFAAVAGVRLALVGPGYPELVAVLALAGAAGAALLAPARPAP